MTHIGAQYLGKLVLVYEMHRPAVRLQVHLVTILHQTTKGFLPFLPPDLIQRVMILANVKGEEVVGREIVVAFGASVCVDLGVVHLEVLKRIELYEARVWRKCTLHDDSRTPGHC